MSYPSQLVDAQSVPTLYRAIRLVSVMVFPFLLIAFVGLYRVDPVLYLLQLREDGLIEWLTFGLLCVSGSLSLFIVIQTWVRSRKVSMFFLIWFSPRSSMSRCWTTMDAPADPARWDK